MDLKSEILNLDDFINGISHSRFKPYMLYSNQDKNKAYHLYCYNLKLSQSLYIILNTWEIVLRNAIDRELSKTYGQEWFKNETFLRHIGFGLRNKVDEIVLKFSQDKRVSLNDKVITHLTAAFWVKLVSPKFWKYFGYYRAGWDKKLLNSKMTEKNFYNSGLKAVELRNRIAHHEPIFKEDDIIVFYEDLIIQITLFSPANMQHVRDTCRFYEIIRNEP